MKEMSAILKRIDGQLPKLFGRVAANAVRRPRGAGLHRAADDLCLLPAADGRRHAGRVLLHQHVQSAGSAAVHARIALGCTKRCRATICKLPCSRRSKDCQRSASTPASPRSSKAGRSIPSGLGREIDFYTDPYSDFGRLTMEMWRACRLVVDTGIHYLGWTREQAIDYMRDNSAMSMHEIRAEVDRYIGWPGQALAYKIGELKIRELRAEAEHQLGDHFDVRAFHDTVLGSGAVPLGMLEANVHGWIDGQRRAHDGDGDGAN